MTPAPRMRKRSPLAMTRPSTPRSPIIGPAVWAAPGRAVHYRPHHPYPGNGGRIGRAGRYAGGGRGIREEHGNPLTGPAQRDGLSPPHFAVAPSATLSYPDPRFLPRRHTAASCPLPSPVGRWIVVQSGETLAADRRTLQDERGHAIPDELPEEHGPLPGATHLRAPIAASVQLPQRPNCHQASPVVMYEPTGSSTPSGREIPCTA